MAADARFRVMGADAHVLVQPADGTPAADAEALLEHARRRLDELERRWSRFLPDSEVSALNGSAGRWVPVSADTMLLVRRALEGCCVTAGAFDPTVLGAVVRAGYDRSFETFAAHQGPTASSLSAGAAEIELDEEGAAVRLPFGVGFDPGGVGKGLAADLVAGELMARGAAGVCVNIGGDLRVTGTPPHAGGWRIAIDDPLDRRRKPTPMAIVELADGGVATSSRLKRRWRGRDGDARHHVIDPLTGTTACTTVLTASVVASEAWRAEVLAKAAFLADGSRLSLLEHLDVAALLLTTDGVRTTSSWPKFAATPTDEEIAS